jgi:hypothetical protein
LNGLREELTPSSGKNLASARSIWLGLFVEATPAGGDLNRELLNETRMCPGENSSWISVSPGGGISVPPGAKKY